MSRIIDQASTFFFAGTFGLALQLRSDLKKMKVDVRRNYFMQGVILIITVTNKAFVFYFAGLLFALVLNFFLGKYWGDGDKSIFFWIIPGLLVVDAGAATVFISMLVFWTLVYLVLRHFFSRAAAYPGLVPIVAAWISSIAVLVI